MAPVEAATMTFKAAAMSAVKASSSKATSVTAEATLEADLDNVTCLRCLRNLDWIEVKRSSLCRCRKACASRENGSRCYDCITRIFNASSEHDLIPFVRNKLFVSCCNKELTNKRLNTVQYVTRVSRR
jgi:hypothetical protein